MNDIKSLFDENTIGILLTVLSVWLTRVFKIKLDAEGNYTRLINALVNFAKGAIMMIIHGEASWTYAVMWAVIGFTVDQAAYFTMIKPAKENKL